MKRTLNVFLTSSVKILTLSCNYYFSIFAFKLLIILNMHNAYNSANIFIYIFGNFVVHCLTYNMLLNQLQVEMLLVFSSIMCLYLFCISAVFMCSCCCSCGIFNLYVMFVCVHGYSLIILCTSLCCRSSLLVITELIENVIANCNFYFYFNNYLNGK